MPNPKNIIALLLVCSALQTTLYAEDECCGSKPAPSLPKVCCEDQIIDPEHTNEFSKEFDFSAFKNAVNGLASGLSGAVGKQGGSASTDISVSLGGTLTTHEECCEDKIETLKRISVSGNLQSGDITFQFALTAAYVPPQLAAISIIFGFDLALSVSVDSVQTCADKNVCIFVTPSGTFYAGLNAYVGNDGWEVFKVEAVGTGSISGSFKYCLDEGKLEKEEAQLVPGVRITVTAAGFYTLFSYTHTWDPIGA